MIRTLVKSMLILSESDVRKCLDMKTCLEANRKALIAVANGTAQVPPRLGLQYHHDEDGTADASTDAAAAADFSLFKPAALQTATTTQNMGMKVVSVRSQNPTIGLPLVPATILHIHPATGIVEAVLAATYLTGARTASSSALAVQHTQRIIDHVVIFGAGLQAEQHVHALRTALDKNYNQQQPSSSPPLLPLPKVTLINRSAPRAESLAAQLHAQGAVRDCRVVRLADRDAVGLALETADAIVTCTNAVAPLWDEALDARIPDDCILTGIGSYTPDMQEVPAVTVDRCCQIWIDAPGAETVGDLKHLLPPQQPNQQASPAAARPVMTLLGDVLQQPLQTDGSLGDNRKGLIFFKGVGTAIQDVLTADVVVQRARELRVGTHVDMS